MSFEQIKKIIEQIYEADLRSFHPNLWRANVAAKSEARIATGNVGSRDAKVSTAMKSSWTVSVTRVESPMRRRGREQRKARTRRQWVTRTSSLEISEILCTTWEERVDISEIMHQTLEERMTIDQPVPNSSGSQQCVDKADLSGDDGIGQVVKRSAPNSDVYFFAPFFKPCISDAFKKR